MTVRLGTRASELAMWQANWVKTELARHGIAVEIVPITTSGDRRQSGPIAQLATQGVFTREIQKALLANEIDLAVHSLKDLPTDSVPGLSVASIPERGDWRDAFVCPTCGTLEELPRGSVVGTGSLRRKCQLLNRYGDRFTVLDIRGNVQTRLNKLDSGRYDALILAVAGLTRLNIGSRIRTMLEPPDFLPAPGQGALALEIRTGDDATRSAVEIVDDCATHVAASAERAFLKTLEGGCIAPIAALARWDGSRLTLRGRIVALDGSRLFEDVAENDLTVSGDDRASAYAEAAGVGRRLALELVERGADRVLDEIRALRAK